MNKGTKKKRIIFVIFLFLCYFLLLIPYIVHTNLNKVDAGFVKDLKIVPVRSLPEDIRDVAAFNEACTVLLVEDSISGMKTVVITEKSDHSLRIADVIEITDKIIEWHVDWHAYQLFGEKFDVIIVGNVKQITPWESFVEGILHSRVGGFIRIGSLILFLSMVAFFIAPLLLIFYASFLCKARFYLWNITAILSLYSFEVFISNMVGSMHNISSSGMSKYLGYLFLVLIPFTFFFMKFEESEWGQRKIKELYEGVAELITHLVK